MTAQYLLTFMFFVIGVYYAARPVSTVHRAVVALLVLGSVWLVWNSAETTVIANYIGVGRGLDLVLPVFSLVLLFFVVALYRRLVSLHDAVTELARHVALTNAVEPEGERDSAKALAGKSAS